MEESLLAEENKEGRSLRHELPGFLLISGSLNVATLALNPHLPVGYCPGTYTLKSHHLLSLGGRIQGECKERKYIKCSVVG